MSNNLDYDPLELYQDDTEFEFMGTVAVYQCRYCGEEYCISEGDQLPFQCHCARGGEKLK